VLKTRYISRAGRKKENGRDRREEKKARKQTHIPEFGKVKFVLICWHEECLDLEAGLVGVIGED